MTIQYPFMTDSIDITAINKTVKDSTGQELYDEKTLRAIRFVQETYPETARAFLLETGYGKLYGLFCRKQMDYGPENIRGGNDLSRVEGLMNSIQAIMTRTKDKLSRITNLATKTVELNGIKKLEKYLEAAGPKWYEEYKKAAEGHKATLEATNEPIEDAFDDTAVYAIIAKIVYQGKWGK